MMVREEKSKTIYTKFDDSRCLMIIPDSEFRKDPNDSIPIFTGTHFLEFYDEFNFIEVMDNSKLLSIGFSDRLEIYNIDEDPLHPKFIKRFDYSGCSLVHVKLDENLLLL